MDRDDMIFCIFLIYIFVLLSVSFRNKLDESSEFDVCKMSFVDE